MGRARDDLFKAVSNALNVTFPAILRAKWREDESSIADIPDTPLKKLLEHFDREIAGHRYGTSFDSVQAQVYPSATKATEAEPIWLIEDSDKWSESDGSSHSEATLIVGAFAIIRRSTDHAVVRKQVDTIVRHRGPSFMRRYFCVLFDFNWRKPFTFEQELVDRLERMYALLSPLMRLNRIGLKDLQVLYGWPWVTDHCEREKMDYDVFQLLLHNERANGIWKPVKPPEEHRPHYEVGSSRVAAVS